MSLLGKFFKKEEAVTRNEERTLRVGESFVVACKNPAGQIWNFKANPDGLALVAASEEDLSNTVLSTKFEKAGTYELDVARYETTRQGPKVAECIHFTINVKP